MDLVGTVRGALTGKSVALHHSGETLTLADCDDVHPTLVGQSLNSQFLANLVTIDLVKTKYPELQPRFHTSCAKDPGLSPP